VVQTVESGSSQVELGRFFAVAQTYHQETGEQAFMPACPVDSEWHRLLSAPDEYRAFCHDALGRDIPHQPVKGEGELAWSKTYEKLYGSLPEVWFRDSFGVINTVRRQKYLETGVFYASWDCSPY
jgi:hypothetical protein